MRGGQLDPEQQRPVLGDVVGRAADPLAPLLEHLAVGVADDDADRRRPGVAAGAAVDVDGQLVIATTRAQRRAGVLAARRRREPIDDRPPSVAEAFHCRAAASSSAISRPLASSKTGRDSSPRSTPHWYQESSQATVTRTSLGGAGGGADRDPGLAEGADQAGDGARRRRWR